jgi:hypothetical protein
MIIYHLGQLILLPQKPSRTRVQYLMDSHTMSSTGFVVVGNAVVVGAMVVVVEVVGGAVVSG